MKRILTTLKEKWPEYLLEAIVIIVSILAAIALENWNESRKETAQEQVLLKQLRDEYVRNLDQLESKIATRNAIIASSAQLLYLYDHPEEATLPLFIEHLSKLPLTVTYDPINNDLVGSGNINRITNKTLKSLLTSWSSGVIQVQEVEKIYLNRYHNFITPLVLKFGLGRSIDEKFWVSIQELDFTLEPNEISRDSYGESKYLPTVQELLQSQELEGYISNAAVINDFINFEAETLKTQINQILALLNEEIK